MKYYIEFVLWYIIVFAIFIFVNPYHADNISFHLFSSFFSAMLVSSSAYAGYHEYKKE